MIRYEHSKLRKTEHLALGVVGLLAEIGDGGDENHDPRGTGREGSSGAPEADCEVRAGLQVFEAVLRKPTGTSWSRGCGDKAQDCSSATVFMVNLPLTPTQSDEDPS
jgi:hypothetical protein